MSRSATDSLNDISAKGSWINEKLEKKAPLDLYSMVSKDNRYVPIY